MKNKIKFTKLQFTEICLILLLIIEFVFIIYTNFSLIDKNLDCDNAKLMEHIIKMWEEKNPAVPNWSYKTTVEWDCTAFFALPFYGLTKNIYFSCGLSNIILAAFLICTVFYIFYKKEIVYPLIASCIICIPYSIGMLDYFNMLFFAGAQYIIKVTIPLLFIGLVINIEDKNYGCRLSRLLLFFFSAAFAVFLFVSSMSSGIYVTVTGILPALIIYLIYKAIRWTRIPAGNTVLFGYSIGASLLGTHINKLIMGGTRGESMVLTNVYEIHSNIASSFIGMFELFGGTTENAFVEVLSVEGITMVGKVCVVITMLICGVIAVMRSVKGKSDLRTILLAAVFIWNCFILDLSCTRAGSSTYEYRYHLIGMLPLICVAAIVLAGSLHKLNNGQKTLFISAGILAVMFLVFTSYRSLISEGEKNSDLKEFVEYCDQYDVDLVYMYNESDNGDICRLISDKKIYMCLCDDGSVWAYDFYAQFVNGNMQTENVIVAVSDENIDFSDEFIIADHRLIEFDRIGNRTIYCFE